MKRKQAENLCSYEDMLSLPHPVSRTHPRMSMEKRAAQFAPFAALTGYGDAVREAERLTEERAELDENRRAELDAVLQYLQQHPFKRQEIQVRYFEPDERKKGGSYRVISGVFDRVDRNGRVLLLQDKTGIRLDDIVEIITEKGEV